jgi:hypothetical protein
MRFPREDRQTLVIESDLAVSQISWLQEVFPDAAFVGIVRDGYAVSEAIRMKEGYAIERCARHWARVNEMLMRDAAGLRRFLPLRYEELARDPERTVERLAGFLGLDMEVVRPRVREGWRLGNTDSGPSRVRDANGELHARLTADDRRRIEAEAGETLARLGYAPASAPGGPDRARTVGEGSCHW